MANLRKKSVLTTYIAEPTENTREGGYIPLPLQSWTVFKFLFFSAPLCLSVSALKKTNSACSKLNRAYTLLQSIIMQEVLVAILNAEAGRHGGAEKIL